MMLLRCIGARTQPSGTLLHFEYDLLRKDEKALPEKEKIRRMTATIKKDTDKLKTMVSNL